MQNRRSIDTGAVLVAFGSLLMIWLSSAEFAPRPHRGIHAAVGRVLAQETLKLCQPGGQVAIISRDTEAFPQPAIDILQRTFESELRGGTARIGATHLIQSDPLRPVEVPPGDFYEVIRRASSKDVIVSFLGPPLLSEEQIGKLGKAKPRIVAFCSAAVDIQRLFDLDLLDVAVVNRALAKGGQDLQAATEFDRLYVKIIKEDFRDPRRAESPVQ